MTTGTSIACPRCGAATDGATRFCMHCGGPVQATDLTLSGLFGSPPVDALREQLAAATAGEYRIESELGRGGMAAVYLAEDLALGRRVAIKVMIPGLEGSDGVADRFLLEARTAAQLGHPHIIPIYAVRTTGQLRFFVMKYIAGRSLDRVVAETGPLPPAVVQAVLAQVGSALEHAHRKGVIHRDIKPANIMLDEDGSAIVADFGIAKVAQGVSLTQTGSTVGTPTYMSPEQCTGKPVTPASDQYALGCVAFELIAGRPPFNHVEVLPVLLAHVSDLPPPLLALRADCPIELAAVVDKMLAKDPGDRWASLGEAIAAAEALPRAADPAVRATMQVLAGAPASGMVVPLPSVPVSPVPRPHTTVAPPPAPTRLSRPVQAADEAPVHSITIEPNGAVLQAGSGVKLRVTARDRAGLTVGEPAVQWGSSAVSVATVTASGVVTALREGEAGITAVVDGVRATVQVRVGRVPVAQVRVSAPAGPWQVGERRLAVATALDQAGAVLPGRVVRWQALDPAIARVTPDGTVEGVAEGQARIEARVEEQASIVLVEVRRATGSLTIVPGEGALTVGQVVPLTALLQEAGQAARPAASVNWSTTDPSVLRINARGELTAAGPGAARIRASVGGVVADVQFQVTRVDVARVDIAPRISQIGVGEELQLMSQSADRLGATLPGRVVTWNSSHPDVATVGPLGLLRGLKAGTTRISATIGGGQAAIDVRVLPVSVAGVRLEPANLVLQRGETGALRALVQSARGGVLVGVPVEWQSSDPMIASVDVEGQVTGHRFGSVRIAATAGGRRATVAVEVRAPATLSAGRLRVGG
ncbi:MAG: Ig-like domain-containing protein [Gemmatimonadales bacterium]|nr:Ig-like domain-containing protein [Gemmatimonadales bacterium]